MHVGLAIASITVIASLGTAALAQASDRIGPASVAWKEIVPGAQFGAVHGDWEKGAHGKYVRFVKGVQIPLHRHSNEYHALVLSGQVVNLFEGGRRVAMAPGEYFYMAGGRAHAHECLSDGGCLLYAYGDKAWDFVPYEAAGQGAPAAERGR